ncbi:MAG: trehalose-phosphatase [Hyphomicrobium sp.]
MRSEPPLPSDLQKFAFFVDIDGTLADIAVAPHLARVPLETRQALSTIFERSSGALAIVSGRQLADIDRLLGMTELPAAGIHGAQLRLATGHLQTVDARPSDFDVIDRTLQAHLAQFPDIMIERKPLSIAVHYRAAPDLGVFVKDLADTLLAQHPRLKVVSGKMIVEMLPATADKGSAVSRLMSEEPFRGRIPVFAGDDITDEDAFNVINGLQGLSVKIGPGLSVARYGFDDSNGFRNWLAEIASLI